MDQLTAMLGPLSMRLSRVEYALMPEYPEAPFLLLPDGTPVQSVAYEGGRRLLVDHRRDTTHIARVEHWELTESPEADVMGMLVLSDARVPAAARA